MVSNADTKTVLSKFSHSLRISLAKYKQHISPKIFSNCLPIYAVNSTALKNTTGHDEILKCIVIMADSICLYSRTYFIMLILHFPHFRSFILESPSSVICRLYSFFIHHFMLFFPFGFHVLFRLGIPHLRYLGSLILNLAL